MEEDSDYGRTRAHFYRQADILWGITMTKLRATIIGLATLLCFAVAPQITNACNGWSGFGNRYAFGSSGSLYGLGYLPVPPYFAVHPPVYYGQRYFRSYGGSPYARRAAQPQPAHVAARVILNPHVVKQPAVPPAPQPPAPPKPETKTAQAQLIINPYYQPSEGRVAQTVSQ